MKKNLQGKSLEVGMMVIVSKAYRWAEMKAGGVPLKVISVEQYPFVMFEVEHPERSVGPLLAMIGGMSSGQEQPVGMVRDTFTASVKWCRFNEVSSEYIEMYQRPTQKIAEPDWLKDE